MIVDHFGQNVGKNCADRLVVCLIPHQQLVHYRKTIEEFMQPAENDAIILETFELLPRFPIAQFSRVPFCSSVFFETTADNWRHIYVNALIVTLIATKGCAETPKLPLHLAAVSNKMEVDNTG